MLDARKLRCRTLLLLMTHKIRERMVQRSISEKEIIELLETGEKKYKDDMRLWIAKNIKGRDDNLLCIAVTLEEKIIIKTVMHHFH